MKDNHMRLKQIVVFFTVLSAFILFNFGMCSIFTTRYIDNSKQLMRAKSIELDQYLPFDSNSKIVQHKSDFQLSGKLPILDGATALFPVYSSLMNATYPHGSSDFDGQDFTPLSLLQKRGTGGAYQSVVEGSADIIFVARPSEKQIQYAKKMGIELAYIPIGYEAFVFLVNSKNPVKSLTVEQIQGIYSGQYTNWKQLGGPDSEIIPLQRIENSGSQTAMIAFMENKTITASSAKLFGKSIGYSFRYYVSDISGKDNVKMLSVNNVYPSKENISNGTYPITNCFYAVYRIDNPNENVRLLIEWIQSDEGQFIIDETGYVRLPK